MMCLSKYLQQQQQHNNNTTTTTQQQHNNNNNNNIYTYALIHAELWFHPVLDDIEQDLPVRCPRY